MTGDELRGFRESMGWSQEQLADLLKSSLGRGSSTSIGAWESGRRAVPETVDTFLSTLALEQRYPMPEDKLLEGDHIEPGADALDFDPSSSRGGPGDSAPEAPSVGTHAGKASGQLPLPGGSQYAHVCGELWELVATGLGMVGAVTGSAALRRDGEIIHADKDALGRAWGKLAEQNQTFRRILVSATSGGAWVEVALVSGITAGKLYRSHAEVREAAALAAQQAEHEAQQREGASYGGDGFPAPAAAAA